MDNKQLASSLGLDWLPALGDLVWATTIDGEPSKFVNALVVTAYAIQNNGVYVCEDGPDMVEPIVEPLEHCYKRREDAQEAISGRAAFSSTDEFIG